MNIVEFYNQVTLLIGDETGATDSLLHVHAGMAILLLARVVTRRSLASWVPFLTVLIVALANEVFDRFAHGAWRFPDTLYDVINTVFWPFVLMVGLRVRRTRRSGPERSSIS